MRPGHKHQQQHQNQRMRGRHRGGTKGPNPLTRSYESNGPDVKIRGTAQHVGEKYLQLARDAQGSGDPVAAENYLQHAEHYFRLIADAHRAQGGQGPGFIRQDAADADDDFDEDDEFAPPFMPGAPQPYAGSGYNGNQGSGQGGGQQGYANGGAQANGQDGGRQGNYAGRPNGNGGGYRDGDGDAGEQGGRGGERPFRGPRQDTRHEARQDTRHDPRADRSEPRQELRQDTRPDGRAEPRQESRSEGRQEPRQETRPDRGERRASRGPRQPYAARESAPAEADGQPIEAALPSFITGGLQSRVGGASPVGDRELVPGQEGRAQDERVQVGRFQETRAEGQPEAVRPDGEEGSVPLRARRRRRTRFSRDGEEGGDAAPPSEAPERSSDD